MKSNIQVNAGGSSWPAKSPWFRPHKTSVEINDV
jgi:hypothetical protein